MNTNVLRYSLFGIAGGQEVDHTFVKFIIYPLTMIASQHKLFITENSTLGYLRASRSTCAEQ